MKRDRILYVILLLTLFITGCRSTKQVADKKGSVTIKDIQAMQALKPLGSSLTAKVRMTATIDDKSFSASGNMKLEPDAGIQIAFTAMGLFEVARLEISPADIRIINKFGREYAQISYDGEGFLRQSGLNYKILEGVFANIIFSPYDATLEEALDDMEVAMLGDDIQLSVPEKNEMRYSFLLDASTGELLRTEGSCRESVTVLCRYSDFEQLDGRTFPQKIDISIDGAGKKINITLKLSNIKTGTFKFVNSDISSYRKMNIANAIKLLDK